MTKPQYQTAILARPACRAWAADEDAKKVAINDAIDVAIDDICVASSQFDFVQEVFEETTLADTNEYVIRGDDTNCRDVISIRFGDSRKLLDKLTKHEADASISQSYEAAYGTTGTASNLQVSQWWIESVVNGFPNIKTLGTPAAGETLYCRIAVRGIAAERIPDEWKGVVMALAEAEMFGTGGVITQAGGTQTAHPQSFTRKAHDRLRTMIDRYRVRGPQDQPYPVDNVTKKQNRRRDAKFGY